MMPALGTVRQRIFAQTLRDLHDAGWPRAINYADPMNVGDRDTWAALALAMMDDLVSRRLVLALGPLAAENPIRALYVLGWTDEDGTPDGCPLPALDDWPVVAGVDDLTPDPLEDACSDS